MYALYIKEIKSFLNSLIGYFVLIIFFLLIGLYLWVFNGANNILESGYSNIDSLFTIAPWIFIFLIPAITMRAFADEKKLGTLELIITKPLSEFQIVLAKFFAGFTLVIIALLPTLIYYYTVYQLGYPKGNIDTGAMWGSYAGLLLLAMGFVAIGICASAFTDSQIIAFLIGVFLCFITYIGFDYAAELFANIGLDGIMYQLGINQHYLSLSRGVIDTRDVIYFLSLSALFIIIAQIKLLARKW